MVKSTYMRFTGHMITLSPCMYPDPCYAHVFKPLFCTQIRDYSKFSVHCAIYNIDGVHCKVEKCKQYFIILSEIFCSGFGAAVGILKVGLKKLFLLVPVILSVLLNIIIITIIVHWSVSLIHWEFVIINYFFLSTLDI